MTKTLDAAHPKKRKDGTLRAIQFVTTFAPHQKKNLILKAQAAGLRVNAYIVLKCGLNQAPKQ